MKLVHKFSIFNKTFMFKVQVIGKPRYPTEGICSRVPNSLYHVLFLDYDIITEDILIEELEAMQQEFRLGDFYIFETRKNGYHAMCLDCMPLYEANQIILSSSCDSAFKVAPKFCEARTWVLRTEPKGKRDRPQYHSTLVSKWHSDERFESTAHAEYLRRHYGIPVVLKNPDHNFLIHGIKYLTANRCKPE